MGRMRWVGALGLFDGKEGDVLRRDGSSRQRRGCATGSRTMLFRFRDLPVFNGG
jgi:hypothetical protein